MVVQHNLTAINSNRMLNITVKGQAGSTEKLSSGYKINRAADDAAGLSISEKMRKQIRGLTQASANAQDGISMVQTAEGALNEVQDMLQRMNELAVKAANGTLSSDDRGYIQNEVDQIMSEIDRVAATTKFNETYLLNGKYSVEEKDGFYGALSEDIIGTNESLFTNHVFDWKSGSEMAGLVGDNIVNGSNGSDLATSSRAGFAATSFDLSSLTTKSDVERLIGTGLSATCGACETFFSIKLVDDDPSLGLNANGYKVVGNSAGGQNLWIDISSCNNGSDVVDTVLSAYARYNGTTHTAGSKAAYNMGSVGSASNAGQTLSDTGSSWHHVCIGGGGSTLVLFDSDNKTSKSWANQVGQDDYSSYYGLQNGYLGKGAEVTPENTKLNLHVGADATKNNQIELELGNLSGVALGLKGFKYDWKSESLKEFNAADVTTAAKALDCINAVKDAIQAVSTQRSRFGAVQNRLEHTIKNLDNVVENTTSAESAIRDTDMATEMVRYSNNNILAQAGQAMLAQANQSNQGVLSLLR
jgi:flagellin